MTDETKFEFTYACLSGLGYSPAETFRNGAGSLIETHAYCWIIIKWGAKGVGFGEYTIKQYTDGRLELDTERMGLEFGQQLLAYWLSNSSKSDLEDLDESAS